MPTNKQLLAMGLPDLPEEAFGGVGGHRLTPIAASMMKRQPSLYGGGGGGLKAVVGVVAAIAIPFAAPAIVGAIASSTAIAAAMPAVTAALSTTVGATIGSAIVGAGLGAVTAAATGQNVGRSALMGAIGGGIGGYMQSGQIAAQGANVGTGSTPLAQSGVTPAVTTPTANAVVTNVGSGTGYWSPELGAFVDPMSGNVISAQNIAYGGTVNSQLANQLSSGSLGSQGLADAIAANGTLAVNTPAAMGGNAAALGSANYYQPVTGAYSPQFNSVTGAAIDQSPAYAQAGLQVTPAMEQAAANAAVQSGQMVNVPGKAGAPTTTVASTAPASGAAGGVGTATAPATLSEALKAKFTDPRNQADMLLRAAGQLAGSALAGDGLSEEEKQLLQQQTTELAQLRETNQELFQQRLQEAQNIIGESKYFDPAYFGMQAERGVRTAGARAKREALGKYGRERAGLRRAEERRFDLGIATGSQTAYLQGADAAQKNRINTAVTGVNLMPGSGPAAGLQYGSYVGGLYDAADRRRRQNAGDIGDLFGTFTGDRMARTV